MRKQHWSKRDPIKNYFPLPNEIYQLGLSPRAVAIYGYLLSIENRETYEAYASYNTIGEATQMSRNTVRKYVAELEERGLITTERTTITTLDGRRQNGCLRYLEYMAERPRSHGLFSADGPADLEKTTEEINGHTGAVWTFVYSLKREDAHRLGYETSESWRKLLLAHQTELAQAMKISPSSFRWCAAFHDEKHHPHIHMMVWSTDPKQGYLTEKGIEQMRSQLSNEIFRDELLSLYQKKDLSYSQVRDAAMEAMGRLIREMETGLCHSPVIAEQMETLAGMLENHKGKRIYGYLKKPAKAKVDAIVDELAKIPEVAECYEQWNQLRDELERYYKDAPREHLPLSQQKEFKAIKNMVIGEAERLRLGTVTFEDARMRDEVDEDQDAVYFAWDSDWQMTEA